MILLYVYLLFINLCMQAELPPFLQNHSPWAEEVFKSLTLDEKIGQIMMIGVSVQNKDLFEQHKRILLDYHVGGIFIDGGYSYHTIEHQIIVTNHLQNISKLPLLVGEDLEWGLTHRLADAVNLPRALTLGAIQDNSLIYEYAAEVARQCNGLGVHINASPVVDINTNPKNPIIGFRSFGDNKYHVTQKALIFIKGLQDNNILACAKHFTGHGDTSVDSHLDLPIVQHTRQRLHDIELHPFKEAINAGVSTIMSAHLLVNAYDTNRPATLSRAIMTDLLKHEMGFQGLAITDALIMKAISKYISPAMANIESFLAGNDILLYPEDIPNTVILFKELINFRPEIEQQLNDSVLKILKAKEWLNLHNNRLAQAMSAQNINSAYAFELKKKLYAYAMTLVHDDQCTVPVSVLEPACLVTLGNSFEIVCDILQKSMPHLVIYNDIQKAMPALCRDTKTPIICALYATQRGAVDQHHVHFIHELYKKNFNVITLLFGSPYVLPQLPPEVPVIVAYEEDFDAQEAAVNVLLGKRQALGVLPITL